MLISCETESEWRTILGHLQADCVHGYLYFEPGARIWTKGFRRLCEYCEKKILEFFLSIQPGYVALHGLCLEFFFPWVFWFYLGGSVGQIIYREYVAFQGLNISCSLASDFFSHARIFGSPHPLRPPSNQFHSFRPGSVHSGSAGWDNCRRVFPDGLRVNSFPW